MSASSCIIFWKCSQVCFRQFSWSDLNISPKSQRWLCLIHSDLCWETRRWRDVLETEQREEERTGPGWLHRRNLSPFSTSTLPPLEVQPFLKLYHIHPFSCLVHSHFDTTDPARPPRKTERKWPALLRSTVGTVVSNNINRSCLFIGFFELICCKCIFNRKNWLSEHSPSFYWLKEDSSCVLCHPPFLSVATYCLYSLPKSHGCVLMSLGDWETAPCELQWYVRHNTGLKQLLPARPRAETHRRVRWKKSSKCKRKTSEAPVWFRSAFANFWGQNWDREKLVAVRIVFRTSRLRWKYGVEKYVTPIKLFLSMYCGELKIIYILIQFFGKK